MLPESYLLYGYGSGCGYGLSRARVAEPKQRSGFDPALILKGNHQIPDIKRIPNRAVGRHKTDSKPCSKNEVGRLRLESVLSPN